MIDEMEKITCEICNEFNIGTPGHEWLLKYLKDFYLKTIEECKPKDKDCGIHGDHEVTDGYCITCSKGISDEEEGKTWNFKYNQAISTYYDNLRKRVK